MYSFDENELIVKTKENACFDLKMRGSICIINGGSGSGKTFLCEYIYKMPKIVLTWTLEKGSPMFLF